MTNKNKTAFTCDQEEMMEVSGGRIFGKSFKGIIEFITMGRKGFSTVYATPDGNFLSPKAVENVVEEALIAERKKYENELLEKTLKYRYAHAHAEGFEHGMEVFKGATDKAVADERKRIADWAMEYVERDNEKYGTVSHNILLGDLLEQLK